MPRDLSPRQPPVLEVAENATTPTARLGVEIWSTTANKKLVWNGTNWVDSMGSGASITISSTPPSNPSIGQFWFDIS